MGDAFVGLCGDKGEIVMSYIPSQIVNYQPSLLLRADVRRGLVRQALYSDYWGLTRTGDGIAADAYDVASDESDESRQQRKTLTDERVPRTAPFAELSQRQQTAVVDVLMHFAYSTEGE